MNAGEMNTSLTGENTHCLDGNEVQLATLSLVPITSEEVARQIRAATEPLTKQLEMLCDLMRELRRDTVMKEPLSQLRAPQYHVVASTKKSFSTIRHFQYRSRITQ